MSVSTFLLGERFLSVRVMSCRVTDNTWRRHEKSTDPFVKPFEIINVSTDAHDPALISGFFKTRLTNPAPKLF